MRKLLRTAALLVLPLAAACGGAKPVAPVEVVAVPLEVQVTADAKLNPDDQQRSLPVQLRFYQLRSARKLEGADFDAVHRRSKEVLGEDLLQVDELLVSPGAVVRQRIERSKEAKVLAAVAVVRRPSGSTWRAVADLPPPAEKAELGFLVEGYTIRRR
jgi:type VI secretion system protein VasD